MADLSQPSSPAPGKGFRSMLDRLREKRESIAPTRIGRIPRHAGQPGDTGTFPVSLGQQRLWFLDQLQPGNTAYSIFSAVRLEGPLDARALELSFSEIVRRHESLRTTFHPIGADGTPMQVVSPPAPFAIPVVDLSDLPADLRDREVHRLALKEAGTPFDLEQGPLLRATLLRLSARGHCSHVVLLDMHHIIGDGWSLGILIREMTLLYESFVRGVPSPLSELPIQYADYAQWQRETLQGETLENLLSFWRRQLSGTPPVLRLPGDRPRPAASSFRGAGRTVAFSAALRDSLTEMGRREGSTLFIILLGAFQTLLHRYSGQVDLWTGAPVANRKRVEIQELIGFFVNTLVMRGDLSGDPTFAELLARLREMSLEVYSHQDVPFEKVVEEVQPERSAAGAQLLQAVLAFDNAPEHTLSEIALTVLPIEREASPFELTFNFVEGPDGFSGVIEYSTDLFDAPTIGRMESHFRTILRAVAADPRRRLSEVPLLSAEEEHQLLLERNDTRVDFPRQCVHEVFDEVAGKEAGRTALTCGDESLTYGELRRRADGLARFLRRLGVGPEVPVAVCLDRSVDATVSLLAVLKAGGAYLPLDPSYPAERLSFMVEDTRASVLLTTSQLLPALPAMAKVVCLDRDGEEIARFDGGAPTSETTPDNLAYVMYTSGSTGRPKGAGVTHRNIVRLVRGANYMEMGPDEVFLQLAPISFDAATLEMWGALLNGGRLEIFPPGVPSLDELGDFLVERKVSALWLTAGLFHQMVEVRPDSLRHVRQLLAGGDALSVPHVRRVLDCLGADSRLVNGYGPTEGTTFSCCNPLRGGDRIDATVPIGRPISNARAYILDANLRLVPGGVPGELYIGGDGLARGYLGRPELTAERFIPDGIGGSGSVPGERLYKTGDLVRSLPDGSIEFLGRIDQQVKIRGFRVELGEVESALAHCPGVADCTVVAREDLPGGKQLVGYVVPEAGLSMDVQALRHVLEARLPEYMVPSAFVFLDALPLTPNGKVDRRALPAPVRTEPVRTQVAPRTPLEQLLAGLWAEVLGVPEVGIHDDFFELGGHSLLATRLMSRVRSVLAVDVPLRELFEAPTVATLAVAVETARAGEDAQPAPPMTRVPRDGALPLSFAQERLWFLDQLEPDSPAYNVPFAVSLRGRLSHPALEHGLREVIARHETLRTTFGTAGGGPAQVIAPPDTRHLPLIDLSGLAGGSRETEAHRLIAEEARRPMNLQAGPLLRVGLIRMAEEEHVVLLTMHHIVSDAWSMEILVRDLGAFYRGALEGRSEELPQLPIQYADFSAWQRHWLQGEVLDRELAFWRSRLERSSSVLDFPTDRLRTAAQTFRGAQEALGVPAELGDAVAALARREGVTVFMAGLAAFNALVFRYSGQSTFNVGTPIAGRNRLETEDLIGFFVNTLVLPASLAGDSGIDEVLAQVREVTLAAHAHQELPFERLVEELEPERSLTHSPLFQIMFVLRDPPRDPVTLPGLESGYLDAETGTTKFDLIFSFSDDARHLSIRYKTDLFDGATIRRFLRHYRRVLEGVVADPRARVADLPLLLEEERHQLLEEWNDTVEPFAPDRCVHELFEEQVERTPDAPAVVFESASLTYRELNVRANRVAGFLRGRGVGPEVPVGVFMERSIEMVVGLYGILKAGGLYVALAPNFPRERLAFMFEEARVPVLLTQRRLASALPDMAAEVVCLDEGDEHLPGASPENPVHRSVPANAAYMIYTSGSTGRPKGVVVEHRQLLQFVQTLVAETGMGPGWTYASVQSPAVDSSKTVFYPPLLTGGCLHMISEDRAGDAQAMGDYMVGERIDMLKIAPSHLGTLMSAGEPEHILPRRLLIYGGEPSTREWAARLALMAPGVPMYSNYGPTETTVGSSMYRVRPETLHDVPLLPLGYPFPNTRYYLLDRDLRPVPVGVHGEIYIAGQQVTRGYLHRQDLTADRFMPDPFSSEPGARMYRSGDRARYLPDGQMESLGRTDHQIKIRGFRIELGEIEAALALHPGIEACTVATYEERPGDKRLAGFVVAREPGTVDAAALREHLRASLPEYMVPSVFVFLDALPRSVHGKVDRQALVVPAGAGREAAGAGEPYEAPRNAAEQRMADLWAEVLGREQVGIHDNFFELGGHSLLATRLVSRIRDAFRTELPLRRLFEQPTVAGLAAELETAGSATSSTSSTFEAPPIVPVPRALRTGAIPLSFAQERLWFLDQLMPGSAVYNIPAAVRLKGRVSIPVLQACLDEIVRRHEVLRTTFPAGPDGPLQLIAPPAPVPLPLIDLSGLDGEVRQREAERLSDDEARRPFDLGRGPLLRAALLRLEERDHLALWTLQHIVSDGWSTGVLVRETAALYEAFSAGRPSPLPELPVQYADFSAWQRSWLAAGAEKEQLAYWRERLRGAPPALDLPTDRPRPVVASGRGGLLSFELPAADAEALRELAQSEGATLFMVFLAAFDAVLARYSGQTDLLVGTPIAGRNRSEIEPLIGFFVNTLVLRADLSGLPTAAEVLARVRTAALEAYARQDLPFERLVEALAPERSLGRSPLFQVFYVYQNTPREALRLADLSLSFAPLDAGLAKFDLTFTVEEDGESLRGLLSYSHDLFDTTTVERMAGHLRRALHAMAGEPGTPVAHLPLLTPAERQTLLLEWNDTGRGWADDLTLHQLVEQQADRTPGALAVVSGRTRLSYRELERSANQLANHLHAAGVRRGDRVGIALERSAEMVVALLGALKAGATYVPLDPDYPAERLAYMLEDSGIELLISSGSIQLPPHRAQVVDLDDPALLAGESDARPDSETDGDDPAYIIYTSGSTGRPKGTMVPQRAIVNHMLWLQETFFLTASDRVLQKTPFSFDASVWEFYAPLLAGATLVMARPGGHREPEYLIRTIQDQGITIFQAVPSLLRAMLEQGGIEGCRTLRTVFCGGEALTPDLVSLYFRALDTDLINFYGPTETAIDVTFWRCRPGQDGPVPIGRPLSNTRLVVVTQGYEPAPIGVPGELVVGGRQVGRGYVGMPAMTAEKFVPDPFSAVSGERGARLYRTGDRVRLLPDGRIDFLGRMDSQVKLRGFRIELGEIETVLAKAPGVARAVVLTRGERNDQLAACVVPDPTVDADAASLRAFLRERLPEHMVPTSFLFLEDLPLSPSGKVDRRALLALDWRGGTSGRTEEVSAPRTPTEEILVGIWAALLDREQVGIRDSFFELGGHSLLATRVASRAREAFGVELPLRSFFEMPTVEALADWIDSQAHGAPQAPPIRPVPRVPRDRSLPLSFAQERLWFIDQLEPGGSVYSLPAALRLGGRLDVAALRESFQEVVRRHETLRTTFAETDGVPFQRIAAERTVDLPVADLRGLAEPARRDEAARLLAEETRRPFDLARGPLLRLGLVRTDDEEWLLSLNLHHIVSDGWSSGVLIREVTTVYTALTQGRPSPLPELPVQYADFAVWQREWLRGEVLEERLGFWREALAGAPGLLELPTDHPRPVLPSYRGGEEPLRLSASLSQSLRTLAAREGATLFMVLLAGFQELLRRHTHQEDLLVGSPIASRDRTEIEGLIGLFINTLVLRRPAGAETFREVVSGVRRFLLQAYAHQDVPFEKLVEALQVERSLAYSPLFQALFVLRNDKAATLSTPGLELSPLALPEGAAKVDLNLGLGEAEDGTLSGEMVYAADLFEAATIRRLLERFEILLEAAAADPGRRLLDLPLLTPAERDQLRAWDGVATVYDGADACLHELIEAQIERTPDAVAVTFEGEALSYRELGQRSGLLAGHLAALGVGPETRVGLCAERSLDMVVGLLGILRAGGAYVPLDPGYPADRLAAMLEDADVPVLLAQSHLVDRLPEHGAQLLLLDALPAIGTQPARRGSTDSAAYAIFTSGSTGRPKGAVNAHRGIVNRLLWMQSMYGLTAADRVLQKTPFSFDVSVWELFLPLMVGARLVMARPGGHQDPAYLVETIEREGITTMHFVPSMLQVFLEEDGLERCASLRRVIASGEALPAELANRFFARLDVELHNLYGPTEAAVDVTYHACGPGEERTPIGRPVANTRIHLVDRELREVPVGVAGELCIGGVQVGRGYLRRPDLTADRFVPDPFGPAGARLYRTGDLARWLPDGEVEYLGRIDHQVKIRGFRIELGEIESALARCPGVREAVVLARGEGADRSLVAYLVPPVPERSAGLREHLRASLPEHMIPTGFVFLEAMPLSPNGKVDRKALARQTGVVVGEAEDDTAPRTETEQRLADLWRQVLGRERVGIHGSFFELGGHSLLATRLMSRVRAAFDVEIPLRELFTSPTVATLAAAVEAARTGEALPPVPPISRVPRDCALPLSFAQERLWFLDQLEPDSPAYNIPFAVSLRGPLSLAALEHGLRALIGRHESLRTTFRTEAGTPVQVIAPPDSRTLAVVDLSGLDAEARRAESRRLIESEARRPFDLRTGPLLRAGLVRLSPREHLALITMHHIVSDAWSVEILVRDLGAFYRGALDGVSPSSVDLPELPIQYADFSAWQRRWLRGGRLELELAFWRGQLRRMPSVLDMPTDRPRPAGRSLRGAQEEIELPAALAERLSALGRREGVTVFMAGLAAFGALIHRYTGQTAFNVGSPIAGRNHLETEDLIGFFVNTLVLPVRLSGGSRFDEALARVREITLLAHAHQELPFESLVEDLEPERSLTHSPLFQVMFVLRNLARQPAGLGDLEMGLVGAETGTTKFDLILSLSEDARQLSLRYRTDLFEVATIRRLLGHYQRVLEAVVTDPRQPVSDLPLLSDMERRQLLEEWNDTAEEIAADRCLHELFEDQVARTPDAPAVFFEGSRLTYRELNEQANRLAHFLRSRGVGPEVPVGLFLERSPEMVVALYGVLKAGGLYVALAPNFPRERLAFMFEQARVPVLLTQERLAPSLPAVDAEVVCLDTAGELLSGHGTENPASGVLPANAAYMIYTSGSTGRPKGVVVEHRQVVSYVRSLERRADLQPGWSFAVVQSPAVDSSKTVLFPALLTGGCLHMISEDRATDAQAMAATLSGERIDVLKIAPSHLGAMMSAGELERLLPARLLIFGGEPSTREWAARLAAAAPDLPTHSNYGPTETTVGSSMYRVRAETLHDVPLLPLGRAFPNTRYYLLDSELQPVPVGVPGELYIAGSQVTRGYLNAPDLTAERFLPDPFHPQPGERMYRSGDRARWLPDGELESLGRTDHQIKIRGFRVELGEIEALLALHPAVEACAVSTYEERSGDRRLAGFVVARQENIDIPGLRAFLRERLPEYMVPSVFVFLDVLPRSVHGKVDRQALVVPEGTEAVGSGQPYEAPRNPVEQRLAKLWGEVLDNGRVGVYDNFFELGGHSLLATRLVSRIRDAFQVELPLRRLFEEPTIAGLAKGLEIPGAVSEPVSAKTRPEVDLQAPPIRPVPHDGPLPLSFAQERLWFIDQLQPGGSVYSIPAALRLDGRLDVAALLQSFREVVRRHEALRTTFGETEGVPFQRITPTTPEMAVELPVTDLRHMPEVRRRDEAVRLLTEEVRRPFNLARGPLMRLRLLRTGDESWLLFLNLHHIVSDGWSMGVLIREVTTLYGALSQGKASPLPELPVQYADFSVWQREWLRGEVLEARLDFWKEALAGAPELLELPTDHPRPATQSYRGGAEPVRLPASLSRSLRELAGREGATMFMVLLAGFQELLRRHTHQEDLLVGSPIANRNRTEIEGLIGFFVNTLVLRRPAGAGTFRELLAGVRRFTLQAYAHQDVPFEKLVEALDVERSLAHSPLFQAMFVLQNNEIPDLSLPGLEMGPVDLQSGTAKFDLHLGLGESANGGLSGGLVYAAGLFEPATIRRLTERFEILLAAAVADPGRRLQDLPVLTPAERDQLRSWDGNATVYDEADACLHELIEARIERTPEAVAVVSEGEALTYRELGNRSRNLAHHLRSLGVGPETLVGICAERSLEMIVGLLGILRSGGAYVPLDPGYPADRLAAMLEDADVPVLLAQSHLMDRLPEHGAQLVLLDAVPTAETQSTWRGGPDSAAYAIFTSGSTGRPKGAVNSHRGIVNRLLWMQSMYGLTPADRVLQKTPFSFDVSVWELFLPLMVGARLVMARPGGHQDPAYLVETIEREGITTIHFVPSMLQVFVEQDDLERCISLRKVMASGEALPAELANRFFSRLGHPLHTELHNLYGPTEAAVDVTYHACVPGEERTPIGRPVANTRIHLVDRELREVPVGVAGELCIGGVQVGRGYLRRPDLTADRFVPDPFGPAGARLYRTGDLARWLPDGEVEYLGRIDHQVKIRGFRIELGEIESALARHPGVREAVVLARGDGAERSLVAYLVPPVPEGAAGLREHLRTRLPEHMIPTGFIFLEAMPLSPNGKVDRKALARMTGVETGEAEDETAPRTELEQRLADLWREILGHDRIGVHTNFFAAGGHSLLAVRLIARIRKDFGRNLPLGALFQGATIERMAALLSEDQVTSSPLVALQPQGSEPPFFFVHPVGGHVFSYVDLAKAMGPEQPFYGLQAHAGRTATSIENMAAEYIAAVRSVQPHGPYRLGGWSLGGVIAHEMARQLAEDGQSVESLTLIDSFTPALQDGDVSEASLLARFANDLVRLSGKSAGKDVSDFDLTDQDTLASLFARAEARGLVPADLALQDAEALFAVFRANILAVRSFTPRPYPGRLLLVRATESPAEHGWSGLAQEVEIEDVAGDHYTILRQGNADLLAELVKKLAVRS